MAWILESNRIPTEVEVLKETRDFITVRLKGSEGAIRLRRKSWNVQIKKGLEFIRWKNRTVHIKSHI